MFLHRESQKMKIYEESSAAFEEEVETSTNEIIRALK